MKAISSNTSRKDARSMLCAKRFRRQKNEGLSDAASPEAQAVRKKKKEVVVVCEAGRLRLESV